MLGDVDVRLTDRCRLVDDRPVPVGVPARNRARGTGEQAVGHPERAQDPPGDLLAVPAPGGLLDQQAQQRVVGVGVLPLGSRREVRRVRGRGRDQLARGDGALQSPVGHPGAEDRRVEQLGEDPAALVGRIPQARGVVEQLADRDVRAAGYQAGQVLLHGVVQTDSVLADQLQDGGGDEHFGHAARPEAAVAAHGRAGRQVGHS